MLAKMLHAKMFFALFALCLVSGFSLPASADDADSSADSKKQASDFANSLGHKALDVITSSASKEDKQSKLEELFVENVDIEAIAKFVLGRNWKVATDEQKTAYLENYKTFIIAHYTSNLTEFTDANFEVTKVTADDRGGNVVTMHLKRPNADDVVVDYTVRKGSDGALKVYDITVEGVSMITTQRSEFSSVVSQHNLDYLISQLAERSKKEEKPANQ